MSLPQEKYREVFYLLLFSHNACEIDDLIPLVMQTLKVSKRHVLSALLQVQDLDTHLSEIDPLIEKFATEYALERIQKAELTVLRLATYELLYKRQVPAKVVLAEAVRLAKKFSTPQASSFVNAVLDHICHDHLGFTFTPPSSE